MLDIAFARNYDAFYELLWRKGRGLPLSLVDLGSLQWHTLNLDAEVLSESPMNGYIV